METIKLDLIPGKKMPSLHASQYDDGREHGIDLFENGVVYKLDGTETLTINERKGDDCICSLDIENTFADSNHIVFASTEQMCAVWGNNICELVIAKGEKTIGTLNFILEIEQSPTENGIESESEIKNLERQIEAITEEVIGDDYYTAEETDEAIATAIEGKADTTYVNTELSKKADKTDTYTKTQVDNALNNKMDKANPTGTGSFSLNRKADSTIGTRSFAEGYNNTASGNASHAEGRNTTASGNYSHSEGYQTTASESDSHAEGYQTTASGFCSHAEGYQAIASGSTSHAEGNKSEASGTNSHAEGSLTIANHKAQHVFGEFNVADDSTASELNRGNYVEIVGNGTSSNARSNARTLDWDGNETLMGDLTYNGNKSLTSEISRLDGKIDNLPAPMIFKGTLGVGGTIQTLPTASASNEGFTYKVITDGTYAGQTAKVGDVFTSNGSSWVYIPSGDEDNDTWRAIKVNGVEKLGNGISSGAVDFVGSENIEVDFDSNGNKVGVKTKNIYTKKEVDDIVYGILPDDTASGSVANFATSLELPIKSLEVDVNAVQEAGTPTPQSPKAITGVSAVNVTHCGKNLFNKNDATAILNAYIGTVIVGVGNMRTVLTKCKPNTKYTVSKNAGERFTVGYTKIVANIGAEVFGRTTNNTATSISITTGNDAQYIVAFVYNGNVDSGTPEDMLASVQIEEGNATSYEAYNGATTLINLGGTYYGGHFTQDKAGHRQFEVTWCALTDLSTLSWGSASNGRIGCNPTDMAVVSSGAVIGNIKSDCYAPDTRNNVYNRTNDKTIAMTNNLSTRMMLYDSDLGNKTSEEVKAALSGKNVIYGLLEPYVIALPDGEPIITLNGTNNIYADTGDCAVEFKVSVEQYVSNHSGGGGAKSLGGVFLGGSNSGNEEEPTEESEETEKTKGIDEPKEEIKTIGDVKKLDGE